MAGAIKCAYLNPCPFQGIHLAIDENASRWIPVLPPNGWKPSERVAPSRLDVTDFLHVAQFPLFHSSRPLMLTVLTL
jgi:hypothetical protein